MQKYQLLRKQCHMQMWRFHEYYVCGSRPIFKVWIMDVLNMREPSSFVRTITTQFHATLPELGLAKI